MLKQSWACLGYLSAPITETPFAELVRLSRTSIADEMREGIGGECLATNARLGTACRPLIFARKCARHTLPERPFLKDSQ